MKNTFAFIICGVLFISLLSCESHLEKVDTYKPTAFDTSFNQIYKDSSEEWRSRTLASFKFAESNETKRIYLFILHREHKRVLIEFGVIILLILFIIFQMVKIRSLKKN